MAFDRRAATTRLFPSTSLEARAPSQDAPRPTSLAAQDQPATGRQPVRVGGVIRAPQKIKDVNPICPQGLPPTAASTVVTLEATIGTDGFVKDVRPLAVKQGGEPPAELVDSAADAVRQWQYTPTLLNNVAVPVIVSVTVEYGRR